MNDRQDDFVLPFQRQLCEEVELALDEISQGGNSCGIVLVGDTGTGKTHALDVLQRVVEASPHAERCETPFLRAQLAQKGSIEVAEADALMKLGRPLTHRERTNRLARAGLLLDAMEANGTLVFAIEEMHNGLVEAEKRLRAASTEWLKTIWNAPPRGDAPWSGERPGRWARKFVIVLSGTRALLTPLLKDEELASRFLRILNAERQSLSTPQLVKLFRRTLSALVHRFDLSQVIDPNDDWVVAYVFAASNGHLRIVEKLLERARTLHKRSPTADVKALLQSAAPQPMSDEEVARRVRLARTAQSSARNDASFA